MRALSFHATVTCQTRVRAKLLPQEFIAPITCYISEGLQVRRRSALWEGKLTDSLTFNFQADRLIQAIFVE